MPLVQNSFRVFRNIDDANDVAETFNANDTGWQARVVKTDNGYVVKLYDEDDYTVGNHP